MKHPIFRLSSLLFAFLFVACGVEEPPLPPNTLQFESAEMGLDESASSKTIRLRLDRAAAEAGQVILTLTAPELSYGTHFTTRPEAAAGRITLPIAAGQTEISFQVNRSPQALFTGQEFVQLDLAPETRFPPGLNPRLTLRFGAIVSTGQTIQLNGGTGGANALQAVYLNLASNTQTPVARSSWDLRLSNGNDFRVFLNNMTAATALVTSKTDLASVTSTDTVGRNMVLTMAAGQMNLVDDVTGAFSRSVIPPISANESENPVVILQRGTGGATPRTDLIKIRILRQGNGYRIQHAPLNATTFQTLDIAKTTTADGFQFISLANNRLVPVEPTRWDIVWGGFIYQTALATGELIPYYFSDLVFTHARAGVQVAQVMSSSISYDAFSPSNLANVTFSTASDAIGSSWRVTFGGTVGVRTDRYYIVKTQGGSYYKLRFVNFTAADGGERGRPTLQYQLIQK